MGAPVSTTTSQKRVVFVVLALLLGVLILSGSELLRSFVSPETLSALIGGEGPSAGRCAYKSLAAYRMSNAILAALCLSAIYLLLPVSAARQRLPLLVPVLALIMGFEFWFEWACNFAGAAT